MTGSSSALTFSHLSNKAGWEEVVGRKPELDDSDKINWDVLEDISLTTHTAIREWSWCCLGTGRCGATANSIPIIGNFCGAVECLKRGKKKKQTPKNKMTHCRDLPWGSAGQRSSVITARAWVAALAGVQSLPRELPHTVGTAKIYLYLTKY